MDFRRFESLDRISSCFRFVGAGVGAASGASLAECWAGFTTIAENVVGGRGRCATGPNNLSYSSRILQVQLE